MADTAAVLDVRPEPSSIAPEASNSQQVTTEAAQRSKKQQKRRGRGGGAAQEEVALTAAQAEHVRVYRVEGRKDPNADDKSVVKLSKGGKAPQLTLSPDRLSVTGHKGFRTARASHGTHVGTWYCEVTVSHLGETGHVRLGWATKKQDLQTPVGYERFGFCYRDVDGSKVHQAIRQEYGQAYGEGDVIGLFIHLPEGGKTCELNDKAITRFKGVLYYVDEPEPEPVTLPGSLIGFTHNGVWQGAAFTDILEGTYYPAASLYTLPNQTEGASVTFNFGPDFKYPPPQVPDLPEAQPISALATTAAPTPPPAGEAEAAAAEAGVTEAAEEAEEQAAAAAPMDMQ